MPVNAKDIRVDDVPPPAGDAMRHWMEFIRTQNAHHLMTYRGAKAYDTEPPPNETLNEFVRAEQASDFPVLHGHSIVGVWSAFECFVEDIVTGFLLHDSMHIGGEAFKKVRVPAVALLADPDERAAQALQSAKAQLSSKPSTGVAKFEAILELVGLGGTVPNDIKNAIYEAQMIRNVWAHKGGLADRIFVERCPGVSAQPGRRLNVGSWDYKRYGDALHMYATIILCRYEPLRHAIQFNDAPGHEGTLSQIFPDSEFGPGAAELRSDGGLRWSTTLGTS